MRITYAPSLELYKALYELRWRDGFLYRNYLPLLAIATVLLLPGLFFASHTSTFFVVSYNLAPLLIALWITIPALRIHAIRDGYRRCRGDHPMSDESTTEINANQIIDSMPSAPRTAYNWDSVFAFAQNDSVTILRVKTREHTLFPGHHLVFFPTPALSPEQRAELDELVSRHGIRRFS